ncbi:MAG: TetR family transcriptional regulator [Syntrophomonadaceae bacterium]|nr:TetR family transcriptional regulator [Syntrophomonadaceae bacterium]
MRKNTRAEVREKILSAGKKVFSEKGYAEATISEIASLANVSPATIYIYFSGKKELFDTLNLPELESLRPEYEKKRNEILSAALILFGEKGFEGTTMDEIAKEIGFTKAALYQYFTSKEELFSSVLHESQLNMNAKRIKLSKAGANWEDVVKGIGRSYLAMGNQPERTSILRSVIRDSGKFPEIGSLYYNQGLAQACSDIAAYLEKLRDTGSIKDVNLKLAALVYLGSLLSYNILFKVISGIDKEFTEKEMLDLATEIFLNGLKK